MVIPRAGTCSIICSVIYSEFYCLKHFKYKVIFTTFMKSQNRILLANFTLQTLQIHERRNRPKQTTYDKDLARSDVRTMARVARCFQLMAKKSKNETQMRELATWDDDKFLR